MGGDFKEMEMTVYSDRGRVSSTPFRDVLEHEMERQATWVAEKIRQWIPIPTRSMVYSTIDEYERLVNEMRGAINLEVTIERGKLLEQVKKNRAKHKDDFDSAMEVYLDQCVKHLRKRAEKVELYISDPEVSRKADEDFTPDRFMHFNLSCPRQYLEVYDQVIESLEWTTEKEIKLSGDQFRNWVMDKWDWSEQFHSTVREYNRLK